MAAVGTFEFCFLDALTAAERRLLRERGLSAKRLGHNLEKTVNADGSLSDDLRKFQIDAVRDRCLYAVCPFTGRVLKSNKSVLLTREVVFYRFSSLETFYVVTDSLGNGFTKGALYFPTFELVVKARNFVWELGEKHLEQFKALLAREHQRLQAYFEDESEPRAVVSCLGDDNYAHHFWNELSGLRRLEAAGCLGFVDRFVVFREPLGPIDVLFPEIRSERITYAEANPNLRDVVPASVFRETIDRREFVVNVGDDYIVEDLPRRVVQVARAHVRPTLADEIHDARRRYHPLLWISVRTGTRTWVAQAEGLAEIIRSLAAVFPRLGVVVDGFSLPTDYASGDGRPRRAIAVHEAEAIMRERDVVAEIRRRLAGVDAGIIDIVGCSLLESTAWAQAIDLYLTHAGSNQHKVAWLANKPGVVHANTVVLRRSRRGRSYYDKVREFAIAPRFIHPRFVKDVPVESRGGELRDDLDNYDVEWRALRDEVLRLIESLEARGRLPGKVVYGVRESIRRRLTSRSAHGVRERVGRSFIPKYARVLRGKASRSVIGTVVRRLR